MALPDGESLCQVSMSEPLHPVSVQALLAQCLALTDASCQLDLQFTVSVLNASNVLGVVKSHFGPSMGKLKQVDLCNQLGLPSEVQGCQGYIIRLCLKTNQHCPFEHQGPCHPVKQSL